MTSVPGAGTEPQHGEIRIGISSWNDLPGFYPHGIKQGDKLTWYARFFRAVEINVSHYRIMLPRTYDQWMDSTPDGFIFDIKAFRELTHFRDSPPDQTFVAFRESYQPLRDGKRLGGVLFQFPPRFANIPESHAHLRRIAARMEGDLTIIEFRNDTWLSPEQAPETLAFLTDLNLAYAIADEPQIPRDTVPPLPAVTNPQLAYLRLHGRNLEGWRHGDGASRYDYSYSPAELAEWAAVIDDLADQARAVHVMFNNNTRGAGTLNATALARLLGLPPIEAPELPPTQRRLF